MLVSLLCSVIKSCCYRSSTELARQLPTEGPQGVVGDDAAASSLSDGDVFRSFPGRDTESDMDYLRSKMLKNWESSEEENSDERPAKKRKMGQSSDTQRGNRHGNEELNALAGEDGDTRDSKGAKPEGCQANRSETANCGMDEQKIRDTARLFVRNLPYMAQETDLCELFGQFGDVAEVHIVMDSKTQR